MAAEGLFRSSGIYLDNKGRLYTKELEENMVCAIIIRVWLRSEMAIQKGASC